MKVGIWDGCANGGMMDSLSIDKFTPGDGQPYAVCEITDEQWEEWEAFLKLHDKWEAFWDKQLIAKENRYRPEDNDEDDDE